MSAADQVQQTLFDADRCAACAGPIERAVKGRPATYCNARCRKRASRSGGRGHVTKPQVAAVPTPTFSPGASLHQPAPGRPLLAIAAGVATPVDACGPVRAYCEVRGDGFGVVFGCDGGRINEPAGPVFPRPRLAVELADLLNARLAGANLIPNTKMAAADVIATAEAEVQGAGPLEGPS